MKKIKIGGKHRPIAFDINAISWFHEAAGRSIFDFAASFQVDEAKAKKLTSKQLETLATEKIKQVNFSEFRAFLYCALRAGALKANQGQPLNGEDMTPELVGSWIDFHNFQQVFVDFMEAFMATLPKDLASEEEAQPAGGKK